jgi:putative component of membrane protein insertase Oxa1/YidC/SpoIIIJ protein YidD
MKTLALAAISIYQRYTSPHKGFCCAYRAHTDFSSCSSLGFPAIRRYGVLRGLKALRQRLELCRVARGRLATVRLRPAASQRGDCDCGFSLCDCLDIDPFGKGRKALNCLDGGVCADALYWPGKKKRNRKTQDDQVHLPKRGGL